MRNSEKISLKKTGEGTKSGRLFGDTDSGAGLPCLTNVLRFLGAISCFSGTVCLAADLAQHIKFDHLVLRVGWSFPKSLTWEHLCQAVKVMRWLPAWPRTDYWYLDPAIHQMHYSIFKRNGRMARAWALWAWWIVEKNLSAGKIILSTVIAFSCEFSMDLLVHR